MSGATIPESTSTPPITSSANIVTSSSTNTVNSSTPSPERNILDVLKKLSLKNKGNTFKCSNVQWAYNADTTTSKNRKSSVSIKTLLNNSINWNFVNLSITKDGKIMTGNSLLIVSELQQCDIQLFNFDLIIKITTCNNSSKSYFFKFNNFNNYLEFLSYLMIWHNLKQSGIVSKWNYHNSMIYNENLKPNEIIVCRFKIFGPLPLSSNAKININENGPENPVFPTPSDSNIKEGWFTVIGHLLPTGILNLISETDGTLLYSINITLLFNSEIRILHHSILQNSNVLFLGFIDALRNDHDLNLSSTRSSFIQNDDFKTVNRILIDFNLRIDLEDWFVALTSFTRLEYLGNQFIQKNDHNLKISKEVSLEIMEAQFDNSIESLIPHLKHSFLYCELILWDTPWFRSAIVKTDFQLSTFWKELINFQLPVSNINDFKILIKKSKSIDNYNIEGENSDEIIGSCFVSSNLFKEVQFLQKIEILNLQNKTIGKLMINLSNIETNILPFQKYKSFENILMNLNINSLISYLEPKSNTKNLESWSIMLLDIYQSLNKENEYLETLMKYELSPIDSLTEANMISASNSIQSLSKTASSNSNGTPNNTNSTNNYVNTGGNFRYHTIFRGNSMLSKSLEKYTVRVGHEYLEKLLGKFIEKIRVEDLNCECDPKMAPDSYKENYYNLLNYIEFLWGRIYSTTNDIPASIKNQWKNLRQNVELSVDLNDKETPLNALSSFIFLRFLCPAILSPKLYNLSKTHYSGKISRTLVLIAKVLMTFSNRSKFQNHKDPFLIPLNEDFLDKHRNEMMIYFDKVTFRKMDFNERLLDMSNIVDRIQLNTSKDILNELPTMPFLIDKYLNIAKLVSLLSKFYQEEKNEDEDSADVVVKDHFSESPEIEDDVKNEKENKAEVGGDYQIEGFDESEFESDFLTSLINEENDALNEVLMKHEFTLNDLKKQSLVLLKETDHDEKVLEMAEIPEIIEGEESWDEFIGCIIRGCKFGKDDRIVFDQDLIHNKKIEIDEVEVGKFNSFMNALMVLNEKKLLNKSNMISNRSNTATSITSANTNKNSAGNVKGLTRSSGKNNGNGDAKIVEDDTKKRGLFKNIFKRGSK